MDPGHLDARGDREVVYCHRCSNEWYRSDNGLTCPGCHSEITEIINPDNDPRDLDYSESPTPPDMSHFRAAHDDDSDPDEADIDDHMGGDHGFVYNRNVRQGAHRDHHDPGLEPVIHRFLDMVHGFGPTGAPPATNTQPTEQEPVNHPAGARFDDDDPPPEHPHHEYPPAAPEWRAALNFNPHAQHIPAPRDYPPTHLPNHPPNHAPGPAPGAPPRHTITHPHPFFNTSRTQTRIHRTTFRSSPYGTASVTIFSGPIRTGANSPPGMGVGGGRGDPFQEYGRIDPPWCVDLANRAVRLFSNIMRDIDPPDGQQERDDGPSPAFLRGLQDILGLLSPANAMAGDAVYSQEALDRIISNLMEANPQSNAAPPASDEALQNLDRRCVNKEMLDGESKTECSICIDDLKEGDKAVFLSCKHWFHEDCVVLWLKEHNTCPICRTPIEKRERADGNRDGAGPVPPTDGQTNNLDFAGSEIPGSDAPGASGSGEPSNGIGRWLFGLRSDRPASATPGHASDDGSTSPAVFSGSSTPVQVSRPPSRRHSRLNEALRSVSSMQERQRDRDRERERDRERGISSGVSYDTSRMQRRNSLSPTSPRAFGFGESNARFRQRSPSQSTRDSQRAPGNGPLNWLRGRFSGGNSNSGPARDGRQS